MIEANPLSASDLHIAPTKHAAHPSGPTSENRSHLAPSPGKVGLVLLRASTPLLSAMKRLFSLILCLVAFLLTLPAADAITTIPRDFDQLVTRADTVFKGTVASTTSQWIGEGSNRHIVTFVRFQVEETYKGTPATEQTLRFMGGTVGDETMAVPDMPQFQTGQTAVLFVVNNGKQFCPLVGVAQGRFRVVRDTATGRERIFTDARRPVVKTADLGQTEPAETTGQRQIEAEAASPAMTAEDFRAAILAKVATPGH